MHRAPRPDVDGVGPHIGYNVVREFESLETLAAADRADLEAVNRVGETRARAIRQRALRTGRSRQIQVRLPEGRP